MAAPAHLSARQNSVVSSIVRYAQTHGFDGNGILIARNIAFSESSLGTMTLASKVGIFQYDPATWNGVFPNLNINSDTDQIAAMFSEISTYAAQFTAAVRAGNTLYANYGTGDYIDAIHHYHLGNPNPNVTKAELDSGKQRNANANSALGAISITHNVSYNDEEYGTGIAAYSFDLGLGWFHYNPTQVITTPLVTVGPGVIADAFGDTWRVP